MISHLRCAFVSKICGWALACVAASVVLGAIASELPVGGSPEEPGFTIVMLPDTQHYSRKFPELFTAQIDWIKRNRDQEKIVFVTQVGDVVDGRNKDTNQWAVADQAMWQLDGVVPWGVALGNHDFDAHGTKRNAKKFLRHFGPRRFKNVSWYGGASPNGLNSYQRFSGGGIDFVILHLEMDVPDAAIAWATKILKRNSSRTAIITTHSYLHGRDGIGRNVDGGSNNGGNSGEQVWEKLVRTHPQIFMVLCGHVSKTVEYHQVSTNEAGNPVLEMLADYQKRHHGGDGWLRLIRIVPARHEIQVRTYSPVLDRFEIDADSQFIAPFQIRKK